jgi:prepilin-type N-terminal cleavage/methylation domain-containing protein/prepilin-type processing-associated H-X9-DG protein
MSKRRGFTLVELLAVLAIIGILVALLLPAVQKTRAAAARLQCANNLKQLGLSSHHYHDNLRALPAGMRWQNGTDSMRLSSWLTQVLPFVEQQQLWDTAVGAFKLTPNPFANPPHTPFSTPVAIYGCPSDPYVAQRQFAQRSMIYVALTSYLGVSGKNWSTQDGTLFRDSAIRFADITDGNSNTLLAGERPPSPDFQFGWWYAGVGQRLTGSADMILGVEEENILSPSVAFCSSGTYKFGPGSFNNQCDMFHFWSPHSGGANFLFADGSVRFLSYGAAPIMPALASRAGGEVVEVP